MKVEERATIELSKLRRLAVLNSPQLPKRIELNGSQYMWTGVGWLNIGKPVGDEVLVVTTVGQPMPS
jgi:hypothetical protein